MTLLSKREAAELLGWSVRHFERRAKDFRSELAPTAKLRNGHPARLYHLSSLPPEAQRKWAERHKVVEIAPPPAAHPDQLALGLSAPSGPNLHPAARAQAEARYRVIEPLIEPERFRPLWLHAGGNRTRLV